MLRTKAAAADSATTTPSALAAGLAASGSVGRGRGAAVNPPNRFEPIHLQLLLDVPFREGCDDALAEAGSAPWEAAGQDHAVQVSTHVETDATRRIINAVDPRVSPDIPFRWTVNPYRGCEHGCTYCYARPTHELLGFSCGLDFETRIVAKPDAPELLQRELGADRWVPETIVMSGVTDPYQPVERRLRITRGCLEVFSRTRHPVSIITKNRMIVRDIDLLQPLAKVGACRAAISITTLDEDLARAMEPRASRPRDRLRAVQELSAAGIDVMVMVAPVIPGLNDREIPAILAAAREHGASAAGWILLRLPGGVADVFLDWLRRFCPDRAAHVESLMRQTRDGALYDRRSHHRMRGTGPIADQIRSIFQVFAARHRLDWPRPPLSAASFRRPAPDGQLCLW